LPKENLDFLFQEEQPYCDKNNLFFLLDPRNKEDLGWYNKNKECLDIYCNYNLMELDIDLLDMQADEAIYNLFYEWHSLKFNSLLDKEWRKFKIIIEHFNMFKNTSNELNNIFNTK
jgi:hypothetical protein